MLEQQRVRHALEQPHHVIGAAVGDEEALVLLTVEPNRSRLDLGAEREVKAWQLDQIDGAVVVGLRELREAPDQDVGEVLESEEQTGEAA